MPSLIKWLNVLALLAISSLIIPVTSADTSLSRSVYKGSISGWKVEMVRTLEQTSEDHFLLKSEAENLFASIRETSEFELKNKQLIPLVYIYERRVFGRSTTEKIEFDWPAGEARYTRSDRTKNNTTHKLTAGILDPALYQLVMQAELASGKKSPQYTFIKRKRLETYKFTELAKDSLAIGKKSFDTIVVERKDQQKDKATKIWIVPELDFQIGQIQHTDDGDTYQIRLADYQGNSAEIRNLYSRLAEAAN